MAASPQTKPHPLEQMARLPQPARLAVLGGVFVGVLVVYWAIFYSGMLTGGGVQKKLSLFDGQLAELQRELAESRSIASNMESFAAKHQALKAELDAALEQLPNETELPVLLTDISSLGKKSGLEFRSFRPEAERTHGFYAEVPIRIEFLGSYHQAAVFFDRLSRLSRIVNITELEMKHSNAQADPPQLKVEGIATTFRFLEESTANAGGA